MARWFDGVDDYISLARTASVRESNYGSIEAWIYPELADKEGRVIFVEETSSSGRLRFNLAYENGYARISARDTESGTIFHLYSNTYVPLNTWTHVVGVKDGPWLRIYLNGVLDAESNVGVGPFTNTTPYYQGIGGNPRWPAYFKGRISNVRVYRIALTADLIKDIMYRRIPPRYSPIIYAPLWERSGTTILDHSGNANNGTIYGATYADDPPMLGGSMVTP